MLQLYFLNSPSFGNVLLPIGKERKLTIIELMKKVNVQKLL